MSRMLTGGAIVESELLENHLMENKTPKLYLQSRNNNSPYDIKLPAKKYLYCAPGIIGIEFVGQNTPRCPVSGVVIEGLKDLEVQHMRDPSLLNSWLDGYNEQLGITSEGELINYRRFKIKGTYPSYIFGGVEDERCVDIVHLASIMTPLEHHTPEEFLEAIGKEINDLVTSQENFTSPNYLLKSYCPTPIA